MNEIQIFENPEFGGIRTIEENFMIWFCGKDVARALGYADTKKALIQHCKVDGVAIYPLVSQTTNQHGKTTDQTVKVKFINEPNLYRLICHSKLPSAERFEKWVFEEVLPALRKTGSYSMKPKYQPTRPLTTDDYEKAAETIAKCHNSRLPIVIDLYRKAGLDIEALISTELKEQKKDDSLVALLNRYSIKELCERLSICKTSIYYYRTGKYTPRQERRKEIIRILEG